MIKIDLYENKAVVRGPAGIHIVPRECMRLEYLLRVMEPGFCALTPQRERLYNKLVHWVDANTNTYRVSWSAYAKEDPLDKFTDDDDKAVDTMFYEFDLRYKGPVSFICPHNATYDALLRYNLNPAGTAVHAWVARTSVPVENRWVVTWSCSFVCYGEK